MVMHRTGNIVDTLNSVSADESIQRDGLISRMTMILVM